MASFSYSVKSIVYQVCKYLCPLDNLKVTLIICKVPPCLVDVYCAVALHPVHSL